MNNAIEAILAISVGNTGSCVRSAASEEKTRRAYSRCAAQVDGDAVKRSFGNGRSQAGAWERDGTRRSLHGSGTKCDCLRAKVAKPQSVEHIGMLVRKALAGCELRRSLAPEKRRKKRAALNFRGANSFQRGRVTKRRLPKPKAATSRRTPKAIADAMGVGYSARETTAGFCLIFGEQG
jgi:hypothetical protein